MKLKYVDLDTVKSYLNIYHNLDDVLIEEVIMPSARGYICSYTKRNIKSRITTII